MTKFQLTPLAENDLEVIVDYIASGSAPDQADAVLNAILDAAENLAAMPGMGHMRADLTAEDVRFWSVHRYFIVYRPDTVPLEIVRVLHGAREPRSLGTEIDR